MSTEYFLLQVCHKSKMASVFPLIVRDQTKQTHLRMSDEDVSL